MHTPGKVGSLGAYLRLVLVHEPETDRRLAMGHRLVRSTLIAWMVRGQWACIATHAPELSGAGSLITARGPTSETRIQGSSTTIQHDLGSLSDNVVKCFNVKGSTIRAVIAFRGPLTELDALRSQVIVKAARSLLDCERPRPARFEACLSSPTIDLRLAGLAVLKGSIGQLAAEVPCVIIAIAHGCGLQTFNSRLPYWTLLKQLKQLVSGFGLQPGLDVHNRLLLNFTTKIHISKLH